MRCSSCGMENPERMRYCGYCGAPLETARPVETLTVAPDAERRQLTVMYVDMIGSTALSERLDPEDLRSVVQSYQKVCVEVVERYEGYVAQYLGDGILVYFGFPVAHEDEAERAVRAALESIQAVAELSHRLQPTIGVDLGVRVGIHTGMVIIGEAGTGGRQEQLATGATPNVAARLQEVARPNSICISGATHRLVQSAFETDFLGGGLLAGFPGEQVYRVVRERPEPVRMAHLGHNGNLVLVGRTQEMQLLADRWVKARQGSGQIVTVCGEAGMGKTHLLHYFRQHQADRELTYLECRCLPYYRHSAFFPFVELLQRMLGFSAEPSPEERLDLLVLMLEQHGFEDLDSAVPLFANLFSIRLREPYKPLPYSPQVLKEQTREALLHLILSLSEGKPLLLVVEDLQWADASTLELLGELIDQTPIVPVLLLLSFDLVFSSPWQGRTHLTPLTLQRLRPAEVEELVMHLAGGKALPAEVLRQIVQKTDGVPLFVEELTRMVLESGLVRERRGKYMLAGPLPPLAIPTTLHDSLMARLDRLAPIKAVTQMAAVIGREFTYELIRAVSLIPESELQQALEQLVDAGLLYQRGLPPRATYVFKHALIQEEAYHSLLKSTRQQVHARTGEILRLTFPEVAERQPELLAHHFSEAGLGDQAFSYWQRAGDKAIQQYAYPEAIAHYSRALDVLKDLPETTERDEQELALQVRLGTALRAIQGYAAPAVEAVYERALILCEKVGETPYLFAVRRGLWSYHLLRQEYKVARMLGERLLALADHLNESGYRVEAHVALGLTYCWLGDLELAVDHLEQGIPYYDRRQHRSHANLYGQDPGVTGHAILAYVSCIQGDAERAEREIRTALDLAKAIEHPFSMAYARLHAALIYHLLGDRETARTHADAVVTLSENEQFAFWLAAGHIIQGRVLASLERTEEGIELLKGGLRDFLATGARLASSVWMMFLAEAYTRNGQLADGISLIDEALALTGRTGECIWEAETLRLKGEWLLKLGDTDEAQQYLACALTSARAHGAGLWENRVLKTMAALPDRREASEASGEEIESHVS